MIAWLCILYAVAAALAVVRIGTEVAVQTLRRRRCHYERRIVRASVRQLIRALLDDLHDPTLLPLHRVAGRRRLVAELIAELASSTYGFDPEPMRRVVTAYGVDRWLLRRIRRSRGARRAEWLRLLADLPHRDTITRAVAVYRTDADRAVRFCALLVQLTATPSQVLRLIADYPDPFTPIEVAEVLHLLRRGLLPIAYRPLLLSPHANLRRVGLEIVAQFGIEEAEPLVVQMAAGEHDEHLARRALYVLVQLGRPLRRAEVGGCIRRMERNERRRLLRFLAHEEYGAAQIRHLFDRPEIPYYERLVGSYKRSLVCG